MIPYSKVLKPAIFVVSLIAFWSCVKEVNQTQQETELHDVVFHAGWDQETKTVLREDGSVWWSPGDEISLFVGSGGNGGYKLTSTNTEPAAMVDFEGQISGKSQNSKYVAVYPYSQYNSYDGNSITYEIPASQIAKEGTFGENIFASIAISDDENLYFRNMCSGIKFCVETTGINKIVLSTIFYQTWTYLSGIARYDIESSISEVLYNQSTSIEVVAPDKSGFETGKYYYAIVPSIIADSGIQIDFYQEDKVATYQYNQPVEFKRGVFKRMINKDEGLVFHKDNDSIPLYQLLPSGIDKSIITEAYFHTKDETVTDICLQDNPYPVYFELDGTIAHYYTTAEVYDVSYLTWSMFEDWSSLVYLDLSGVVTHNSNSFYRMFAGCSSLKTLDLSSFVTGDVTNMSEMFADCLKLESIDLSSFDTSNVETMSNMFSGCASLKTLDLSNFNTEKVQTMDEMFGSGLGSVFHTYHGCQSLERLDLSSFNTSNVYTMRGMFMNCTNLKEINLSGWDTINVLDMNDMFENCCSLEHLDLSSFQTDNVTTMWGMVRNCSSLTSLDLSNFNTRKVTTFQQMFYGCRSLEEVNVSSFSSESLYDLVAMFAYCSHLKQIDFGELALPSNLSDSSSLMFEQTSVCNSSFAIRCTEASKEALLQSGLLQDPDKIIWVGLSEVFPYIEDYKNPDLYYSSDYSMDGKTVLLNKATVGKGIDISLMGDAYSDRMIADGTYENDMVEAMEAIFSIEPFKSYRSMFNIHMIYVVSENEVANGNTALCSNKHVGNTLFIDNYLISSLPDKHLDELDVLVIGHDETCLDGTGNRGLTFMQTILPNEGEPFDDFGQAFEAIALVPRYSYKDDFRYVVQHEFGHLFAKLEDEYEMDNEISEDSKDYLREMFRLGYYKNIDVTSDPLEIKWSRFLNDSRYESSGTGIFEGGAAYFNKGVWRPSQNSIMNSDMYGSYNVPSREAIYYRIHKLAYGRDWQYDYETFVQQDLKNIQSVSTKTATAKNVPYPARVNKKPYHKMEKSTDPDGKTIITVIMD